MVGALHSYKLKHGGIGDLDYPRVEACNCVDITISDGWGYEAVTKAMSCTIYNAMRPPISGFC
jgi:hypothetical protein